ncbi:mitochondrial metalloendopeptidase OMA1 [Aaosphaeria arxii CBS 175.79]|uniref:Mitochondrial metalloendopeptidase OMA1 n=1 Tax=Aaosphaeria arxii CBS 175.79 TaxID=1450172 RepID=A0A6A5XQZ0_9PLEO|nr:mitochondrial metalloendopeptidase OMA1 [Aaosphaeria arxii CBS 175.79]KAF2015257.1 mitochondrial metalloendopeptidase OMA1 [Aaosphaeria arxii CBS 175.79]
MFRWRPGSRILDNFRFQSQFRAYRIGGRGPQYQRFGGATASNILYRWAARPTFYRDVGFISVGAGGFYLYNLEEVPVSGRRRFNIISPQLEAYAAQGTMEQIKEEYRGKFLPEYDLRVRQVKKVLARLLPYVSGTGLDDLNWEVHVIESPEQNAFVIPGGKVFVFTGILPLCKDEHGIAAVLGHEIAHVVAHHTAERMSQAPLILVACVLLSMFDISFYSSKLLLDLFLSWPGSRKQEAEADYIGLLMMAQGCYRPEAAMEFWARMEKLGQQAPPQVLSTHPSNHNREEKIREWLPQALEKQQDSDCHSMMSYADQFAASFGQLRW